MKPRIFIGSSREGYKKAEIIKNNLNGVAECQIWDEGFFENNKSSFESLSEGSVLFDFAIMLATIDDKQLKRGNIERVARDNIIFEFGLYVGRLGKNRCFFLSSQRGFHFTSIKLSATTVKPRCVTFLLDIQTLRT